MCDDCELALSTVKAFMLLQLPLLVLHTPYPSRTQSSQELRPAPRDFEEARD